MDKLESILTPLLGYVESSQVLQSVLVLLISLVVAWVLDRIVLASLARLTGRLNASLLSQLLQLVRRPIFKTVVLIGLSMATRLMSFEARWEGIVFSILTTLALLVWTAFFLRLVNRVLREIASDPAGHQWINMKSLPLFENAGYVLVVVMAVYYVFSAWNVDMTAWLASAGIIGIAVGFAAKDTLANLFSGVFILADAPYNIGDFVVLDGGERGEITKIGLRSTRLLTRDDVEVTVPNSVMGNSKVINESGGRHEKFRIRVAIGVAYGSDIDKVRAILDQVALTTEGVCTEPVPTVRLRQFGPSSLDFELLCWVEQPVLRGRILDRLNCAVYKQFMAQGIEIPYAKQDVFIKELPKGFRANDSQPS